MSKSRFKKNDRGARKPKQGRRVLCQGASVKYAFIDAHRNRYRFTSMCQFLKVIRSGYYAWKKTLLSNPAIEDARILEEISTKLGEVEYS